MAGHGGVEVKGAEQLAASMRAAGRDLADWSAVNEDAAAIIANDARGRAPRRSGRLSASIRPAGTRDEARVDVGVVYAGVQEFGWPRRNIRGTPYLYPALADTERRTMALYSDRVDEVISTVKGV